LQISALQPCSLAETTGRVLTLGSGKAFMRATGMSAVGRCTRHNAHNVFSTIA